MRAKEFRHGDLGWVIVSLVPVRRSTCPSSLTWHLVRGIEQSQTGDAVGRQWSAQQTATTTERTSSQSTISGAAIGTAVGAAAGAAIGAAAGSPATGAAIGAGGGFLGGAAIGASRADAAGTSVQHRYNIAYMQCMYAKGNQIPVSR